MLSSVFRTCNSRQKYIYMKLTDLPALFPQLDFQTNFVLAPLTTVKIGGPAELFCAISNRDDFIQVVQTAKQHHLPVTILGWGANTLIADRGIKGLVIKNMTAGIEVQDAKAETKAVPVNTVSARWQSHSTEHAKWHTFEDLNYDESDQPSVQVRIDAGVALPVAITQLIQLGITGLQWFARIPATMGGAIVNNIHGGTHFLSEYIVSVDVITPEGKLKTLPTDQLEFGYDYSRFHHSGEVIVSALFKLYRGDAEKARSVVKEWSVRKQRQPAKSLGCIFQNLTAEQQQRLGFPTNSIGYVMDQVLHLKNFQIGDAKISDFHAAFIENVGQATAADYLAVIKKMIAAADQKLAVKLKPEIFFLGFTNEELKGIKANSS